jgi:hypothetical protein
VGGRRFAISHDFRERVQLVSGHVEPVRRALDGPRPSLVTFERNRRLGESCIGANTVIPAARESRERFRSSKTLRHLPL